MMIFFVGHRSFTDPYPYSDLLVHKFIRRWLLSHIQPVKEVDMVEFLDAITKGATLYTRMRMGIRTDWTPEDWTGKIAAHFHNRLQ